MTPAPMAAVLLMGAMTCQQWTPESAGRISYGRRVLLSLNQTINTLLWGQPDETISSRLGRNRKKHRIARAGCWVLDRIDPCHCTVAVELDENGDPRPHQFYLGDQKKDR